MKPTLALGDINGGVQNIPDRKIVREAQQNMCTNVAFWSRIKAGKFPYIFNPDENKILEASYAETMSSLKIEKESTVSDKEVYWLTDAEIPDANAALKKIGNIDKLKSSYKEKLKQFTR